MGNSAGRTQPRAQQHRGAQGTRDNLAKDLRRIAPRILAPTDFSEHSTRAFQHALAIAVAMHGRLTLLHTGSERHGDIPWRRFHRVRETLASWGQLPADAARGDVYQALDLCVAKVALRDDDTCHSLVEYLRQYPTDLLVMAAQGHNRFARLWRTPVADSVVENARANALIIPKQGGSLIDSETGRMRVGRVAWIASSDSVKPALQFLDHWLSALGGDDAEIFLIHDDIDQPGLISGMLGQQRDWQFRKVDRMSTQAVQHACLSIKPDLVCVSAGHAEHPGRADWVNEILRELQIPVLAINSP